MKLINTLELLCKIENQQGGTIHQFTKQYKCSANKLINISQDKLNIINDLLVGINANNFIVLARKYYKRQAVSIQDIARMLIKYETIK